MLLNLRNRLDEADAKLYSDSDFLCAVGEVAWRSQSDPHSSELAAALEGAIAQALSLAKGSKLVEPGVRLPEWWPEAEGLSFEDAVVGLSMDAAFAIAASENARREPNIIRAYWHKRQLHDFLVEWLGAALVVGSASGARLKL